MIVFKKGNLLQSDAEALVNTVNTVGVMGKGIALGFKKAFPYNYAVYQTACRDGTLTVGKLLTVADQSLLLGERTIINFPTKQHWCNPSRYKYIEEGLIALRQYLQGSPLCTVALPALGCGNGGLDWMLVRESIKKHLGDLSQAITVFEPVEV